jgi:hypothetical protein
MKAMRNIFIILVSVFVLMSCDYLDTRPIQDLSNEELWSHSSYGEGLLSRAYSNLSTTWDVQSEYYTENAVPNLPGANLLALGGWTLEGNPIGSWDSWYTSIRYLNEFIDNGGDLLYSVIDLRKDSILKSNRIGEAYFLRAYYQWMLLKTYGGYIEGDTEAKGFIIVTDILSPGDELNLERDSYEDCVAQIAADCDEAIARLPLRYSNGTDPYTGLSNRGRGDKLSAMTLKAFAYLWAASPAYGPSTFELWDRAARSAYDAIVASGGAVALLPNTIITENWYRRAQDMDFIWIAPAGTSNALEVSHYTPSLFGAGLSNPSQNFVDAFPTKDGYPISVSPTYVAATPYLNRDPRLTLNVFHNGMAYTAGTQTTTVATFDGGADAPGGLSIQGTRTGYYMRKLLTGTVCLRVSSPASAERFFVHLHKTELYLAFAEAANEAYGPADATLGASAYDVMVRIRTRAGIDSNPAAGFQDAYMDSQRDAGTAAFRTFIRNERRIELAFEGRRFYDIRRWNEPLNHTVRGVQIIKDPVSGVLTYNYRDVENHTFQDYMRYIPVPYYQTLNMSNLKQNAGW